MSLADLKVGTRLWLGMGLIVLLSALLAATAWAGAQALWQQTAGLHDHPLLVRRALADLQADIAGIQLDTKGALLADSPARSLEAQASIEARRDDSLRHLAVIEERYLGPKEDVVQVGEAFSRWSSQSREVFRLLREGRRPDAIAMDGPSGAEHASLVALQEGFDRIDRFALARGDAFYREAQEQRASLERRLGIVSATILGLSLLIAWLLTASIRRPIQKLTDVAREFKQGRMDGRVTGVSGSELGVLGSVFNDMAGEIQAVTDLRERVARISDVMVRHGDPRAFFLHLIRALMQDSDSQVGAAYLRAPSGTEFLLFESIGLSSDARRSFSSAGMEGELGPVLASRAIQRVTDIPPDTRFAFSAVTGDILPREIVTIPVVAGSDVVAVISLASVRPYRPEALGLLEAISGTLTARVSGVLIAGKTQELAARLEEQNRELDAQKRELIVQADELTQHNTELEMQKRQLDDANRLKTVFLSNMSHELRTPLNSVIALSGVLERRLARTIGEEERGYLEIIQRNGKNLLALINDILDLSRIESGREELRLSRLSLRDLASDVLSMLEVQANGKDIALRNLVDAELPLLVSDADKCRHILQNLVANAVKFTERGGVEISAAVEGNRARLSVRDTGIGIPADKLGVIFEEFRQADETTSRRFGGTGLGLSIARKYARLLGGDVTVESAVGEGSTFTLSLPLALDAGKATTAVDTPRVVGHTEPRRSAPPGRGRRILLVEDSEPAIVQMTEILRAEGHLVEVARTGRLALEVVSREPPDGVILDLMMPEVDGFQVLEALRRDPTTRALPVIILTAKHVTLEELAVLETNHVHQLIQKGDVDRGALLDAVAAMLADPEDSVRPSGRRRPGRSGRPVVLVVEDNPDSLRTARAILQERYEVLEARDGREGVEIARRNLPDLILMDIAMPVMDGIRALAELRKDHALRDIPVYALTASAMAGDREAILAHGFDGYVSKPIDGAVLMTVVAGAMGG
ncbi:MAG: response regulator [Deltaproteobacteria bacterium]